LIDLRNLFFKNRSYTPIPLSLIIIFFSAPIYPLYLIGLGCIILGESIRINAVRFAGGITRTLKVGAPKLCTSGPYSKTRNPLYLGNIIIYLGVVLLAGGKYFVPLFFITLIFFTLQYAMIISLEEKKLMELFGNEYQEYINNVPRLFPRISKWKKQDNIIPTSIIKTLIIEKRTLQNIVLINFIIITKYLFNIQ
tara:strand:+ start:875 stop:1459 length:585 start_codon:yes stop_codon:yes gene_type:complete